MAQIDRPNFAVRLRPALDLLASLSVIVVSIVLTWTMLFRSTPSQQSVAATAPRPTPPPPSEPVSLHGAWLAGDKRAKVAIIEYSDFQCPYCAKVVHDSLPIIRKRYVDSGRVLLAFRHLPLEQIHPFALKAAEAAECAGREGRFWQMHDYLFTRQGQLNDDTLRQSFSDLGLPGPALESCLSTDVTRKIRDEAQEARALSITGTPTFFFGLVLDDGRVSIAERLSGALPVNRFESVLENLLTKVRADLK